MCTLYADPTGTPGGFIPFPGVDYDAVLAAARADVAAGSERAVNSGLVRYNFVGSIPSTYRVAGAFAAQLLSKYFNETTNNNITVNFEVSALASGQLGGAGSTVESGSDYCGVTGYPATTTFAAAFERMKTGAQCGATAHEISMTLTTDSSVTWYTGTDGATPTGQYDMVTVIMHELLHGFGFFTAINGGTDTLANTQTCFECMHEYDRHVFTSTAKPLVFDNSTAEYKEAFVTGVSYWRPGSGDPIVDSNRQIQTGNPVTNQATFLAGTTGSHWINSVSCTTNACSNTLANALMRPLITSGTAIHVIGENTEQLLTGYGYNIRSCSVNSDCSSCLSAGCSWCFSDSKCGSGAGGVTCSVSYQWVTDNSKCSTGNPPPTTTTTTGGSTCIGFFCSSSSTLDFVF